jgi:hypothetical protein
LEYQASVANFITYRKFQSIGLAKELTDLLEEHKIEFHVENNSTGLSDFIVGQNFESTVLIKLRPAGFERVNSLLENFLKVNADELPADHYLLTFDDEELLGVIKEPDNWSIYDFALARQLLAKKGIAISSDERTSMKEQRTKELSVQEYSGITWILIGYLLALLGGIIGILIGIHLCTSKKTLPDGSRIYSYKQEDRFHGQVISVIGIGVFLFFVYYRFKKQLF